ncbi:hypothetical protein OC835_005583 [Tilletia horrida]|nr:hypothetical protein OC835_005583 [Tilletia horrida]
MALLGSSSSTGDERAYAVYDVFTSRPTHGNPVAIVLDAHGLSPTQRQSIAAWTNLSETTFLEPATHLEADYKLDIYTPAVRLPFAGHPTLGSANAWLDAGGEPKQAGFVTQECGIGLVKIKISNSTNEEGGRRRLAFAAPPFLKEGDVAPALLEQICTALGLNSTQHVLAAQHIANGPPWIGLLLRDADVVKDVIPPPSDLAWAALGEHMVGVVGAYPDPDLEGKDISRPAFEVRAFCGGKEHFEDPVTGSLNAGIAKWLISTAHPSASGSGYIALQGRHRGRDGQVFVEVDAEARVSKGARGTIWVGGDAVPVVKGTILL